MKSRRASSRRHGFGSQHREQLLTGIDWFGDAYGNPGANQDVLDASGNRWGTTGPGKAWLEEAACADWEAHKDELMSFWLQDPVAWLQENVVTFGNPAPGGPGSRPFGWWWFSAPEPRRCVGNDGTCTTRNVPRATPQLGAVYESERDFLMRHGLLIKGLEDRIIRGTV